MPPEFGQKTESKIGKPEIKKGVELDEETKEATLLFLESHTKGEEMSKKDKDSLTKTIEQLKIGKFYEEVVKWLKRPSPIEKELIEAKENLKTAQGMVSKDKKKNKKELCMIESQLHIYVGARARLIGKFKKLEEKDI